ncbi:YXWGXW repeat-containing protein [Pseudomonas silvicola]|uniref:YXWGXW repeat-containing protein n=1 Tax=Pseudomonas sp. RIT-To-2 TaxID=3462541 RepID=UPI00227BF86A|nr:YXWGXW repeat-containing protein [Pseudomonas silvicola]
MLKIIKATLVAALVATTLTGCIVEPVHPRRPPPPVEVVPVMPAPGYHWVPGHYRWGPGRWVWEPGHWRTY